MVGDLHLLCVIFRLSSFRTFDAIERIAVLFSLGMASLKPGVERVAAYAKSRVKSWHLSNAVHINGP